MKLIQRYKKSRKEVDESTRNIKFMYGKPYIDTGVEGRSRKDTIKKLQDFMGNWQFK